MPNPSVPSKEERAISAASGDPPSLNEALRLAIGARDFVRVDGLLGQGADIYDCDESGETSLHVAAAAQSYSILLLLINPAVGQRPRIRSSLNRALILADAQGYTPLHRLIQDIGNRGAISRLTELSNMLTLMIDCAADSVHAVNEKRDGDTPLHSAVRAARNLGGYLFPSELVSILLKHGADVNRENKRGETPLDLLVGVRNEEEREEEEYEDKVELSKIARLCIAAAVRQSQPRPSGIQGNTWLTNLWAEIEEQSGLGPGLCIQSGLQTRSKSLSERGALRKQTSYEERLSVVHRADAWHKKRVTWAANLSEEHPYEPNPCERTESSFSPQEERLSADAYASSAPVTPGLSLKGANTHSITGQARTLHIPMIETINTLNCISEQILHTTGKEPSPEELSKRMGLPEDKIHTILKIAKKSDPEQSIEGRARGLSPGYMPRRGAALFQSSDASRSDSPQEKGDAIFTSDKICYRKP